MSFNKFQLWLIVVFFISSTSTNQTNYIKMTDESEGKTIDTKAINDSSKDIHILTSIDSNEKAINESYSHNANENSHKSVIDVIVNTEDENLVPKNTQNNLINNTNPEQNNENSEPFVYGKTEIRDKHLGNKEDGNIPSSERGKSERKLKIPMQIKQQQRVTNNIKVESRDIESAVEYGMRALEELTKFKEPYLYKLGLFLDDKDPAARVANFGAPRTRKANLMSQIGFATLEASKKVAESLQNVGRQSAGVPLELQSKIDLDECPLTGRPRCPPASRRFRTADGTCNNLEHPWRGSAMLPMQRFLPPTYEDGIQSVRRSVLGSPLPSPREVSTVIHREKNKEIQSVTLMFMQWGQFIDHDIISTVKARGFNGSIPRCCDAGGRRMLPPELLHPACLPIEVPRTDPFLSRFGIRCMEFIRSAPSTRINCELGWREQINQVTPYIDASTIYGSDIETSDSIRTFRNGQIFYGRPSSEEPLNPPDPIGGELCRAGALSEECLQAGDNRVSENPGLVAIHTIFVRYHNKVATVLSKINPHWSDERVFQETRKIVYSVVQHITYREYLPIVLGPEVMDLFELRLLKRGYYDKYDARINPAIANSFGTAAFRFGHSMVQNSFMRTDSHHIPLPNNVSLHNEISNFENIWSFGSLDRLLLGLSNQAAQKRDEFIAEELTNHLFQFSDAVPFGMDLAAINVQRGRDHGIPPYTSWREPCGLTPIKDWRDLEQVMSISSAIRLRSLFAHVDDIDLFTAGLAEKPLRGAVVGPTFACIIAQQFSNLRRGDRFWYENKSFGSSFSPAQLEQIRKVSLAQIMCQTLDEIETIQPFVFLSSDNFRNIRVSCDSPDIRNFDLAAWTEKSFDFNFNSISDNIDSFESERSQKGLADITRFKRELQYNSHLLENITDAIFDTSIRRPQKQLGTEVNDKVTLNQPKPISFRGKRDNSRLNTKHYMKTTQRPYVSSTKTTAGKSGAKSRTTTKRPNIASENKYGHFNNIPSKPSFPNQSTSRPTKQKQGYYQVSGDKSDEVTYLLGILTEHSTKLPPSHPLQVNININYSPHPIIDSTTSPIVKTKMPYISTKLPAVISTVYASPRPQVSDIYRPTNNYIENDVVVITKRPFIPTRPTLTITKQPETVSYPTFLYNHVYEKPNDDTTSTKRPVYFIDNMEYATTNKHKRPNTNGLGLNFDGLRPTTVYSTSSESSYDNFVEVPVVSHKPMTDHYHNNYEQNYYGDNKRPVYISTSHYQLTHSSNNRPSTPYYHQSSTSEKPAYIHSNQYVDKYTTARPAYSTYHFDKNKDTIIVTSIKKPSYNSKFDNKDDKLTDDILNGFFYREDDELRSDNRKSSGSTGYTSQPNIDEKLDFESRILHKTVDKDLDRLVQIASVKREEMFGKRLEGDIKKTGSTEKLPNYSRELDRRIRSSNVEDMMFQSNNQWVFFNATNEDAFAEVPELLTNVPCSYELPRPMVQFSPPAEFASASKVR